MLRQRQKPDDLKDTYRLWIGFLKHSTTYADYCQSRQDQREHTVDDIYELFEQRNIRVIGNRESFDNEPLTRDYMTFGNIHSSNFDFDQWWETKMRVLLDRIWIGTDSVRTFNQDIDSYVGRFERRLSDALKDQADGLTNETIRQILQRTIGAHRWALPLTVLVCYPTDILLGHVKKIIDDYKKQHKVTRAVQDKFVGQVIPFPFPRFIRKEDISSYERYLRVWELRNREKPTNKWVIILREVGYERIKDSEAKRIKAISDYNKARRIIRNAGKGRFPGKLKTNKKSSSTNFPKSPIR